MQEIKNVYVDVYCIRDGMVHIFFVQGQGTRRKIIHFVCTQNFCGVLRWGEGWRWNRSESWLLFGEVW